MEINEFQEKLLEDSKIRTEDSKIRTEMSVKRTKYSKIRTGLAISAFIISLLSFYLVVSL